MMEVDYFSIPTTLFGTQDSNHYISHSHTTFYTNTIFYHSKLAYTSLAFRKFLIVQL